GLSLVLSLYSMLLALLAGKPLYVFPQSIGPLRYPWERILIRFIFSKARIGFVREPVSQITLQECGLQPEKFRLVPDMAFAFHSASANEAKEWLRNFEGIDMDSQEQPLMGITVVNWGGQNKNFRFQQRYEDACTAAIRLFLEKFQGKVFFFPQVCGPLDIQDDRVIARKIRGRLSNSTRCVVLEKQPPPQILKTLYGFMDVFIATRLHSAIFAWSQGIPTIAISYQPKTRGVAQMLGLEDWVIRIEDITSESLSDTLTALWEMRESLKAHLQQVIPNLIKQIDSIGDWIAQDLEELANAHKNQSS
ncbi:polysaccharide pyruvyl transferase family protein, partial [Thermanaerothrix sp.]|uniref:polysaccharide pyruvyl transferase family protein n=1 Tax=Thermanaerothrix sp. TaxID=2972675 RepID=UPI003C7A6DCB